LEVLTRSAYAYAYNDPVNLIDPTGLGVFDGIGNFFDDFACNVAGVADFVGTWSGRVGVGLAITSLFVATPAGWAIGLGVLATGASATQFIAGSVAGDRAHMTQGLVGTTTGLLTFGTWEALGSEGLEVSARAAAGFGVYSSSSRQIIDETVNRTVKSDSGCGCG
jgi:hypothetical protein